MTETSLQTANGTHPTSAVATLPEATPPAAVESAALISMIERAARDPTVDINKMERLFQMHRDMEAQRAERAFNAAMALAQAELVPVVKRSWNPQTRSKYANLAAIAEAALPIIHRCGFGLSFSEFESKKPDCLGVACDVTHSGGHRKHYEFHVPMDGAGLKGNANKTPTHAYGSSFSYGRRYATCGVFNIATKDDDDGNAAGKAQGPPPPPPVTPEQVAALEALMTKAAVPAEIILEHFKVEALADLTVAQHKTAMAKLNAKLKATQ